ncbi:hypothetical protein [Actinophytocola sp.]|jgi:hypothetical protein|uniref:hypothetical protein n=1 Tax=Actinophytocola sp. TaxID=1872138 RepID=UPI002EDB0E17
MRRVLVVLAAIVVFSSGMVASATADQDPTQAIAVALADGDGRLAAQLIAASGFGTQPDKLGHTIFVGGNLAVAAGSGEAYRDAVAYGFTRGGVSLANATLTFSAAATEVVAAGLTPEQALVGGTTVVQTYEAYAICVLGCPN